MEKAKVLVSNKNWLIESNGVKVGSINRDKFGFSFFRSGIKIKFKDPADLTSKLGFDIFSNQISVRGNYKVSNSVHDYPCDVQPYNGYYDIKRKLPIYTKTKKSKCQFCAGYYLIKKRKNQQIMFCPKLILLEKYQYQGPFYTEKEAQHEL